MNILRNIFNFSPQLEWEIQIPLSKTELYSHFDSIPESFMGNRDIGNKVKISEFDESTFQGSRSMYYFGRFGFLLKGNYFENPSDRKSIIKIYIEPDGITDPKIWLLFFLAFSVPLGMYVSWTDSNFIPLLFGIFGPIILINLHKRRINLMMLELKNIITESFSSISARAT